MKKSGQKIMTFTFPEDIWSFSVCCFHQQGQQYDQTSSSDFPDPNDETTDTEDNEEEDLGVLDDQRSIIIHLLSQLKLGMDLTQVFCSWLYHLSLIIILGILSYLYCMTVLMTYSSIRWCSLPSFWRNAPYLRCMLTLWLTLTCSFPSHLAPRLRSVSFILWSTTWLPSTKVERVL